MTSVGLPLSQHRREIRLVRFLSSADSGTQSPPRTIHLESRHASLDDENTRYWALSYVWGDPADPITIYVDDKPVLIRQNLYAALVQLHKHTEAAPGDAPLWLWIDTICIDQSSTEERTGQVKLMKCIFSQAEAVQMWLGPGTEKSDMAMDFISRFGPRAVASGVLEVMATRDKGWIRRAYGQRGAKDDDAIPRGIEEHEAVRKVFDLIPELVYDEDFQDVKRDEASSHSWIRGDLPIAKAIEDVMTREYWNRIWIVQEVALASQAFVLCGTKSVPLDFFDSALSIVDTSPHGFKAGLSGVFYECIPLQIRRKLVYNKTKPTLKDILVHHTSPPDRPFYSASDPRDFLFGTLGVISNNDRQRFVVDYGKTIAGVFTEITRALLQPVSRNEPVNFGLEWCCPRSKPISYEDIDLPSWVCDWSTIGRYGFGVWPAGYGHSYNAGARQVTGAYHTPEQYDGRPEILRRSGCCVSVVTHVMAPPRLYQYGEWSPSQLPGSEIPNYLSTIFRFAHLGPQSGPGEDYIWRTASNGKLFHRSFRKWKKTGDETVLEEVMSLLRQVWRAAPINAAALTPSQMNYIEQCSPVRYEKEANSIEDKIDELGREVPRLAAACSRGRTLFKTNKLMLGSGHVAVQPGDIVVLLWGEKSPFVLRPREKGGFTFVGDAYVDGIMYGEFLKTEPEEEVFDIY